MAMTVENVQNMIKMIAPIGKDNKNKFVDDIFVGICGEDIETDICKLYIKLSKQYTKETERFIKSTSYGRRAIRCTYIPKEREKAYKEAKKEANDFITNGIYDCKELINLLNKVTEAYVKYMKEAKRQHNTPTPFFIRGIIALTAWLMIDTVRTVTILACGEPKLSFNSQTFIIEYMRDRSKKKYNYDIFSSGKKMLTYKWRIKPTSMYNYSTYYAPEVPFNYAGHKDGVLGYIVKEMIEQINYTEYADIFGGSGRAILQFPLCLDKKVIDGEVVYDKTYHMNDLNKYNVALWTCLQDKTLYRQMIKTLEERQKFYLELQQRINEYVAYVDKPEIRGKGIRKNLKTINDKMLIVFNQQLHKEYNDMYVRYINGVSTTPVEMAVDFVLLHQFVVRGRPVMSLANGVNLFRELQDVMCCWVFDRDFKGMRNVYQKPNVKIHNMTDLQLISQLPNKEDVVLQLDPPYPVTAQYGVGAYSLQDIKALMDSIKCTNSKRKFIFHCQTKYNKTVSNTIGKRQVFKNFIAYWGTFTEDLWVTFTINCKSNMILDSDSDIACMNAYLTSLFEGIAKEDGSIGDSDNSPEIIITNFKPSVTSKYNLQGLRNPYSVLLADRKVENDSYRVVTIPMKDYLPQVLARL